MGIATTDPILGGNIPLAWGHSVFQDLSVISNVTAVFNVSLSSPPYNNATVSFTSMPGWSMGLTKQSNTSKLIVFLITSSVMTVAAGQINTFGVLVDGTDYKTAELWFNAINVHQQVSGGVIIPNLTAGPKTLQVRGHIQVASGANMQADVNDRMTMIVFESP